MQWHCIAKKKLNVVTLNRSEKLNFYIHCNARSRLQLCDAVFELETWSEGQTTHSPVLKSNSRSARGIVHALVASSGTHSSFLIPPNVLMHSHEFV